MIEKQNHNPEPIRSKVWILAIIDPNYGTELSAFKTSKDANQCLYEHAQEYWEHCFVVSKIDEFSQDEAIEAYFDTSPNDRYCLKHVAVEPEPQKPTLIERLWHFIENGTHDYNGGFFALRAEYRNTCQLPQELDTT